MPARARDSEVCVCILAAGKREEIFKAQKDKSESGGCGASRFIVAS